jgi:hypothetical protein
MTEQQFRNELHYFTGSENFYRHGIGKLQLIYTDGVDYVVKNCACYWLLDVILSWQLDKKLNNEAFQVWHLMKEEATDTWRITCEDGNDNLLLEQQIGYSDFPFLGVQLWFIDKQVLMLPSEY